MVPTGFENRVIYELDENLVIHILPVSYFLATKFSAFLDRGEDPRTSRHFEDIIYVQDNHLEIVAAVRSEQEDVGNYLKDQLRQLLDENMEEAISAHLNPFIGPQRYQMMLSKIREIIA